MIVDWLGIPAAILAWGFALYVFVVAPSTRGARFLVAMLFVDGLAVITSYDNLSYLNPLLETAGIPGIPGVVHQVSDWALVAVYLPFVGMTLSSPLAAPLRHPVISRFILFGGLGVAVLLLLPAFRSSPAVQHPVLHRHHDRARLGLRRRHTHVVHRLQRSRARARSRIHTCVRCAGRALDDNVCILGARPLRHRRAGT